MQTIPVPPARTTRRRGLTLIEVTIAIGIVALTVVPLLGLLSLSLASQAEAAFETRAVLVARGIIADLRQGAATAHGIPIRVAASGNPASDFVYPTLDLIGEAADFHLLYTEDGRPARTATTTEYNTGYYSPGDGENDPAVDPDPQSTPVTELVRIRIIRASESDFLTVGSSPRTPAIYRIEISVEQPAAAPEPGRKKVAFTTALNLTDER